VYHTKQYLKMQYVRFIATYRENCVQCYIAQVGHYGNQSAPQNFQRVQQHNSTVATFK